MGIQIITAVAQPGGLSATTAATAETPDGAAAGIGFADLLAQQMHLPDVRQLVGTGAAQAVATEESGVSAEEQAETGDLSAQLLPWLTQGAGLTANNTPFPRGNSTASGQQQLSSSLSLDQGRGLTQLAPQDDFADAAAPETDIDPEARDKAFPSWANLQRATADASAPRIANTAFAIASESGKAADVLAAKNAATPELNSLASPGAQTSSPLVAQARDAGPSSPISTPLNDQRWATDFGQKVVWIARAEQQNAQININPPQLGPIQITLNMEGDKATAVFASAHAEVRQAIETAMPRLREMLADAGINLGQTNVGSQFAQQQQAQENRQGPSESARHAVDKAILPGQPGVGGEPAGARQRAEGLVDLFA